MGWQHLFKRKYQTLLFLKQIVNQMISNPCLAASTCFLAFILVATVFTAHVFLVVNTTFLNIVALRVLFLFILLAAAATLAFVVLFITPVIHSNDATVGILINTVSTIIRPRASPSRFYRKLIIYRRVSGWLYLGEYQWYEC